MKNINLLDFFILSRRLRKLDVHIHKCICTCEHLHTFVCALAFMYVCVFNMHVMLADLPFQLSNAADNVRFLTRVSKHWLGFRDAFLYLNRIRCLIVFIL